MNPLLKQDGNNDDNQGTHKEPTGITDPFRKRSRLSHSPPTRSKSAEYDTREADATPTTTDTCSTAATEMISPVRDSVKKRRTNSWSSPKQVEARRDEGTPAQMAATIRDTIRSIDREVTAIAAVAVERNTKREIKEASAKLTKLIRIITSQEAQNLLRTIEKPVSKYAGEDETNQGLWESKFKALELEMGKIKILHKNAMCNMEEKYAKLRRENINLKSVLPQKNRQDKDPKEVMQDDSELGRQREEGQSTLKEPANELSRTLTGIRRNIEILNGCMVPGQEVSEQVPEVLGNLSDLIDRAEATLDSENDTTEVATNRQRVLRILESGKGFEALQEIKDSRWQESVYLQTKIEYGNPLLVERSADLALAVETDLKQEGTGISRMYKDRFPELSDITLGGKGTCTTLVSSSKVMQDNGQEEFGPPNYERYLYIGEVVDGKTFFDFLSNMKVVMSRHSRNKVAIPRPEGVGADYTRKIAEFVFRGTGMEVIIYRPMSEQPKKLERTSGGNPSRTTAIIVDSQGKEYPELLKEVKEGLEKEGSIPMLRGVRKTKQGNLIIEMAASETKHINDVVGAIQKNVDGAKFRIASGNGRNTKRIQIRDLDLLTTDDDIISGLSATQPAGHEEAPPRVITRKEVEGGCQSAIVELGDKWADKLVDSRFVVIGIVRCRVRDWMPVTRCFRCWEPGHVAANCKGTDRTKSCHKCGLLGHEAKACAGTKYCPLCEVSGHMAGSAGCKKVQTMMRDLRRKAKVKKW